MLSKYTYWIENAINNMSPLGVAPNFHIHGNGDVNTLIKPLPIIKKAEIEEETKKSPISSLQVNFTKVES